MTTTDPNKQILAQILSGFLIKRLSFSLGKIILFEDEDLNTNEKTLKHYDLECEGISDIEGIMKQKILNQKMKAFHMIKTYHLKVPNKAPIKSQMASDTKLLLNQSKDRQPYKPASVASVARLRHSYQSQHPLIYLRPNVMPEENDRLCPEHKFHQQASCYGQSLGGIMNKLHQINNVGSPRSYHDSVSAYMSRNVSATELYYNRSRESKRMFIMDKLSNLERNVSDLSNRGENYQIKSRVLHNSSLHQQYQMRTPNARSTMTLQRIPGGFTRISEDVLN